MKKRIFIIATILVIIIVGGGGVLYGVNSYKTKPLAVTSQQNAPQPETNERQTIGTVIKINGAEYKYNTNLRNILVLGIDLWEPFKNKYEAGDAGQSDFLLLLSMDKETKTGKILQIHRNAMTSIDLYDNNGNYKNSITGQVTLQYAYGIGGEQSCWAAKKTVSELLYNLDIDGYITLNGGGIDKIVDAVGGVDVTVTGDYTDLDDKLTDGTTVHMDGALAKKYIHDRDITVFDSATDRMHRQTDFMMGLSKSMSGKGASALYESLEPLLESYILTDLTAEEMKSFASYDFDTEDILTTPGTTIMGEVYEEYDIDEGALQQLILDNFYIKL